MLAAQAVVLLLVLTATVWADRDRDRRRDRDRDDWVSYEDYGGCIGGAKCGNHGWQLRIRLRDAPVTGIRFHAHDNVGDQSRGHLRVRIDGSVVEEDLDVPKDGDWFEYRVHQERGNYLYFEAFAHDEVVVEDIEVQYRGGRYGRRR
jgi:hypothetical protein